MRLGRHIDVPTWSHGRLDVWWLSRTARALSLRLSGRAFAVAVRRTPPSAPGSASGPGAVEVLRFILGETTFPRSVAYCLEGVQSSARLLPLSESVIGACHSALTELSSSEPSGLLDAGELHCKADRLQIAIASINDRIAAAYFGKAV
jgi:hypothetical protein